MIPLGRILPASTFNPAFDFPVTDAVSRSVETLYADEGLEFVPVRHHSPRCALLLRERIESVRPDVVLIEGPEEANQLLPLLMDEAARPPLAVYLYATDARAGADSTVRHRCFAPFAAMSPEWVALRTASAQGSEARFIDLAFTAQLLLRDVPAVPDPGIPEPLFNDDGLMARADPVGALVETSSARGFDEWWDRHFESGRNFDDPLEFFRGMHYFCAYLRLSGGAIDRQTEARELHMAGAVAAARADGKRCLVVTGGFHCVGIAEHLAGQNSGAGAGVGPGAPGHRQGTAMETGVHLVPYTLGRLNRAAGYAAGMPDAGYYARAWEQLNRKRERQPFAATNRLFALELGDAVRHLAAGASTLDAIEAVVLSERLAALRNIAPGRPELRDAVRSAFVKQALDGSESQAFTAIVDRLLAGDAVGQLPKAVPLAPLVVDFRRQCRQLSLRVSAGDAVERHLDIYRSTRHRLISRLLHRLAFLGVPYASRVAGPNFATGVDLQRVRETWSMQWQVETEPVLTECSHLGGSLEEASAALVLQKLYTPGESGVVRAGLFLHSLSMGLHDLLAPIAAQLQVWVRGEADAIELGRALQRLVPAYFGGRALGAGNSAELEGLLTLTFERFCQRLTWLGPLPPERESEVCDVLSALFGLVRQNVPWASADTFFTSLLSIEADGIPAKVDGVISATLLLAGVRDTPASAARLRRTFGLANLEPDAVGCFMEGFLRLGRARLLQEPALLELVSEQLLAWDEDEFLTALPAMRLAFAQLSPAQVRSLGECLGGEVLSPVPNLEPSSLALAARLRDQVLAKARSWGLT